MSLEAMKLALAALELTPANETERYKQQLQARVALRQAIEQAERVQPEAWQWLDTAHFRKHLPKDAEPGVWRPLYTAPVKEQS